MKIIHDKVINLHDGEDHLNTKIYADTLSKIITEYDLEDPITIGLYGGWGTGKSSIVRTLEEYIEKNHNKDYGIITYDAWKYSQDSLRRSIFLSLNEKFGLFNIAALKSIMYEDQTHDSSVRYKLSKGNLFLIGFTLLLTFIGYHFTAQNTDDKVIAEAIKDFGLLATFFELIMFLLQNTIVQYRSTVNKSKLFSPEQFENLFLMMIESLTGKRSKVKETLKNLKSWIGGSENLDENYILKASNIKHYKKVIIVIDNIDRCEPHIAKEVLLTVKNFLSIKNCIFIIPIADESITAILDDHMDDNDKDEFLRKYFNIIVRIQAYGMKDIKVLIEKIMKKNGINFNSEHLVDIIRFKFGDTPRRILQFLNNFQVELELAKIKEEKKLVQPGVLTQNIDLLAVISIIKDNWSKSYNFLCDDPRSLYRIATDLQDNKSFDEINNLMGFNGEDKLPTGLLQFIQRNLLIIQNKNIKNWDPFFRLADYDATLPDNLRIAISIGSYNEIKDILEKDETITLETVIAKCIEIFNGSEGKSTKIDKSNALNLLAAFYSDDSFRKSIDENKLSKIISGITNLNRTNLKEIAASVNLDNLVALAMFTFKKGSKDLFSTLGQQFESEAIDKYFRNEDQFIKLIKLFSDQHTDILTEDFICRYLKTLFTEHPTTIVQYKDVLDKINDSKLPTIIPTSILEQIKSIPFPDSEKDLNYELAEYLIEKKLVEQTYLNETVDLIANIHSTHITYDTTEDNQVLKLINYIVTNSDYEIFDEDLLKIIHNYHSKVSVFWSKEKLEQGEMQMLQLYLNTIVEYLLIFDFNEGLMDILRQALGLTIKDIDAKINVNHILDRLISNRDPAFFWKVASPIHESFITKDQGKEFNKSAIKIIETIVDKIKVHENPETILSMEEVNLIVGVIQKYYTYQSTDEDTKLVRKLIEGLRQKFNQQVVETLSRILVEDNSNLTLTNSLDSDSQLEVLVKIFEKNLNDLIKFENVVKEIMKIDPEKSILTKIKDRLNTLINEQISEDQKLQYYNILVTNRFLSRELVERIFNYCNPIINDPKRGDDALQYLNLVDRLVINLNKDQKRKLKTDLEWMKKSDLDEIAIQAGKISERIKI